MTPFPHPAEIDAARLRQRVQFAEWLATDAQHTGPGVFPWGLPEPRPAGYLKFGVGQLVVEVFDYKGFLTALRRDPLEQWRETLFEWLSMEAAAYGSVREHLTGEAPPRFAPPEPKAPNAPSLEELGL